MAFRNQLDKTKFRELRQVSIKPRDNNSSFGGSSYKSNSYGGRNSSFGGRSSRFNDNYSKNSGSSRNFNSSQGSYSNDSRYNDNDSIRLFIAKGKNDNFDELSLTNFIKKETGVDYKNINNIKILDQFSFFATEAKEAKKILDIFQQKSQNGKSLITRAKERK